MSIPSELHPTTDEGDTTAAPIADAKPRKEPYRGGRPRLATDDPDVEARRAADRERKRLAKLRPPKPVEPEPVVAPIAPAVNEAAAAVEKGAKKTKGKAGGGQRAASAEPRPVRQPGWLRRLLNEDEAQPAASQIRHTAMLILKKSGLPWAQEVLDDPNAKDSDKSKAVDLLAKLSVGYKTPDMADGEDAPELPAPIFQFSEGELPDDGSSGMLSEEDAGAAEADDRAGPQLAGAVAAPSTPVPAPSAGPIPHLGVA